MRCARIVGASFGALLASTACATAPAATHGNAQLDEVSPQVVSRTLTASERDSVVAQAFADRQGPRGWIYADAGSESGARRVRADFHLDDDAYVVVGHLDADGVLRIVFPTNPGDDGFVKGDKSYMTDEFFAGFNDQYRYRAQEVSLTRGLMPQMDSYDGGLGYVFMIASWRPMRADQFSSGGIWNRYELTDDDYLKDPRPAIQELASLLTGDNREAFTVQYARYYSTIASVGTLGDSFDSNDCSGFSSLGYASMPFGYSGMLANYNGFYNPLNLGYGTGGCFGSGVYGFNNYNSGFAIAPPVLVTPRRYAVIGNRPVPRPQPVQKYHFPTRGKDATPAAPGHQGFSPDYRRRGLMTTDDGTSSGPEHSAPRSPSRLHAEQPTRPGIEQMINRRPDNGTTGADGIARFHGRASAGDNQARPVPSDRPSRTAPADRQQPQSQSQPRTAQPRTEQPRADRPHVEQAPRAETPRPATPPPAPAAQSTARTAAPPNR